MAGSSSLSTDLADRILPAYPVACDTRWNADDVARDSGPGSPNPVENHVTPPPPNGNLCDYGSISDAYRRRIVNGEITASRSGGLLMDVYIGRLRPWIQ